MPRCSGLSRRGRSSVAGHSDRRDGAKSHLVDCGRRAVIVWRVTRALKALRAALILLRPRERGWRLAEALEHPETRSEAAGAIRGLIDAIVLTPAEGALEAFAAHRASRSPSAIAARDGGLRIELRGNLAAMLGAAQNTTRSPETGDLAVRMAVVARASTSAICSCGGWRRKATAHPELVRMRSLFPSSAAIIGA